MPADPVRVPDLHADPRWRQVDFISDLHLHAGDRATADLWRDYLAQTAADAVFILGDLFEAWPGDDVADAPGFAQTCAFALRVATQRQPVYFMHGNRDFLVGQRLAAYTGLQLIADPTVLVFGSLRILLSHGDALCLADTDYLRFREKVRAPGWAEAFLARPLAEREGIARQLRAESEARQASAPRMVDVDATEALRWLAQAQAQVLVHGHTHRPADHPLGEGQRRVLSDWDAGARPPRAEVMRLDARGRFQRLPLPHAGG